MWPNELLLRQYCHQPNSQASSCSADVERDIEKALIAVFLLTEDKISDRNAAQIRTVLVIAQQTKNSKYI